MIKKKEKKKKRTRHPTPYEEVMEYVDAIYAREDQEGMIQVETLDGGIIFFDRRRGMDLSSFVGDAEMDGRPVKTIVEPRHPLPALSQKAQRLYFKLKHDGKVP